MDSEIEQLNKALNGYKQEVKRLKIFESLYNGIKAELEIGNLLPGSSLTSITFPDGDIITIDNKKIEIKFSSNHSKGGKNPLWLWHKIFGNGGKKVFDYLLLVGEVTKNPRKQRYFVLKRDEISNDILTKSGNINIRYSLKTLTNFDLFLKQFETFPENVNFIESFK